MCRQRKRRCDGGERCNHCAKHDFTCTYVVPAPVRPVAPVHDPEHGYDHEYVKNLKLRLNRAEASLRETTDREPSVTPVVGRAIENLSQPFKPPHPDDSEFLDIADSFRALSLDSAPPDPGFQGKSSAAMLVKMAVSVKSSQTDRPQISYPSAPKPWKLKPWDRSTMTARIFLSFPDEDVLESLVSLYFSHVNLLIPLLHRPTFEQGITQQLHRHHTGFASTLLLVCAVGSLYLADISVSKKEREALGWSCYNQVELCGHRLHQQATLYDLQAYCLAAEFLERTSNPRFCWSIVSFGLRIGEDIGAYRRKVRTPTITTEEELEKRAFWFLQLFDTQLCATLGRSVMYDPLHFDISLPSECDDEYWESSGPGCQPPNRPATVAFINCLLGLYRTLHLTLRLFYSTTRSHTVMGISDLRPIVLKLDSALDKWFSSIPQHLSWDPARSDELFFHQSAALHCAFYYTRILIHRAFLPAVRPETQTGISAVATCNEAARNCIQVADIQRRRRPDHPLLFSQTVIFTSAMILILNMWHETTTPGPEDANEALAYIHIAIDVLKCNQERWPSSVFSLSVLEKLASMDPPAAGGSERLLPSIYEYLYSTREDSSSSVVLGNMCATGERAESQPIPWTPSFPSQPTLFANEFRPVPVPPVFVGDAEIRSTRFHRPYSINLDI
ncbi:fungal-specific transcription factor domain-containing protein [Mycena vulgaris]|nr:fungal-specific transcription factor domain-containing protein [Mycena vulgaris]